MSTALLVSDLFKIFGSSRDEAVRLAHDGLDKEEIFRKTGSVIAVNDVSFAVDEGEIFVVMGLSGSGKSTLIRCINRLQEPSRGRVLLKGEDVTAAGAEALRRIRRERVAMVFQHFALLPHKTVAENAEYGLKVRGVPREVRREKALDALRTVGLEAWADLFPRNLSGGMQQRVGLARALAVEPDILLMDEPFSALDPLIRREIQDELIRIQEHLRTTIVFITHDLQEALKLGDRIAIMKEGRFVQVGTPEEIVTAPADDYVLEFIRDVDRSRVLTFRSVMDDAPSVFVDAPVATVRALFARDEAEQVFVTCHMNMPQGIITRDALAKAGEGQSAHALMQSGVAKVRASKPLHNAFDIMQDGDPIAVVDRNGRLVGAVDPARVFGHLRGPRHSRGNGSGLIRSPS